jgi:hypothetical protein
MRALIALARALVGRAVVEAERLFRHGTMLNESRYAVDGRHGRHGRLQSSFRPIALTSAALTANSC